MEMLIKVMMVFIALEHLFFLYLEMFAWETLGKKIFRGTMPESSFSTTKAMAANQGLYNGFLAAGLVWSLCINDPVWKINIAIFFLGCILAAGLYGGYSVSKKIMFIQGVPALICLLALLLN